jgi:integrase
MSNVKKRDFKLVLRKAGLRHIRFHDLRHTYASLLLANGAPITYVSNQMGHANSQITLKVYCHWMPDGNQRNAVNKLPVLGQDFDAVAQV